MIHNICPSRPRDTNRFSVEVNVGAQEKVVFNLTYQELLKRKRGSYEHVIYINPKQIVADFQIHVSIEESRELTEVRVPPIRNELEQNLEVKGMIVQKDDDSFSQAILCSHCNKCTSKDKLLFRFERLPSAIK